MWSWHKNEERTRTTTETATATHTSAEEHVEQIFGTEFAFKATATTELSGCKA